MELSSRGYRMNGRNFHRIIWRDALSFRVGGGGDECMLAAMINILCGN